MIRGRSFLFWVLVLVLIGLPVWWVLYVPYTPRRLYAPIPINAAFISHHENLVSRWNTFYKNPLAFSLFTSLGVKPSALHDLETDPEVRAWFDKLASRDLVLAHVPSMGSHREPVWIGVSWLGGQSQRLRWQLNSFKLKGFTRSRPYRGRYYWIVDSKFLKQDRTLTLALVEGMLIACLSWHHDTMCDVLDTYDGLKPSVLERGDFPETEVWCGEASAPDRGWADLKPLTTLPLKRSYVLTYAFSDLTPTTVVGCAQIRNPFGTAFSTALPVDPESLGKLINDAPIGLVLSRSEILPAAGDVSVMWQRILLELFKEERAGMVMTGLFGGEFGGRFKGIRVPSVMVGFPVKDESAMAKRVARCLDRLNAGYRWGLIPNRVEVGDRAVYVIEGTAENLYSSLSMNEQAAFSVCGGWLIFSSNSDSLIRLVEQYEARRKAGATEAPAWTRGVEAARAPGYAWIDLAGGSQTLRIAIGAYSLVLLMEGSDKTQKQREQLAEARAWINALEPLGLVRLWPEAVDENLRIHFEMGN